MIYPDELVTEASKYLLAQGITILQGNRLAPTDSAHLDALASHMKLNGEKDVGDMGCGFGEVARFLHNDRLPSAHFWLVNTNQFQLDHCPIEPGFFSFRQEDMCATTIPDESLDLVMFNYSLCHVDARAALREAARIAKRGGHLFVYDYERLTGDNAASEQHLAATFLYDGEFRVIAAAYGWRDVETIHPGGDDSLFRDLFSRKELYDDIMNDLTPVIWRAHRES
jgi:ubiquinone/menaquinone biosynthesis C-methylase UbiE